MSERFARTVTLYLSAAVLLLACAPRSIRTAASLPPAPQLPEQAPTDTDLPLDAGPEYIDHEQTSCYWIPTGIGVVAEVERITNGVGLWEPVR